MAVFKIRVIKEQTLSVEASSLSVLKDVLASPLNLEAAFDVDRDEQGLDEPAVRYTVIAEQPEGVKADMFEREGLLFHTDSAVPADADPKAN